MAHASPQSSMMAHQRLPSGPPPMPNGQPPASYRAPAPPAQQQRPAPGWERLSQMNEQTWVVIGQQAKRMGNREVAVASYQRALFYNQYNLDSLHAIAGILKDDDKYHEAIEYLKTILSMDQRNGESWNALGHCYLMMDDLQEAYQAYQSALYNLRDPKEPMLWYGIGILYDRYGSLDHAEEAFSQVMRMAPDFDKSNEIYFRLGIIYKQQGKFQQSLECFRWIADNPPRPLSRTDIWFQIGHVYEGEKDYAAARDAYKKVLQHDPNHAKVLQQLGWLHHQESADYGNQEQAIEYLEKSVNSDQTDAQSWYLLGRCYMSQQKFPKAYEAYQQAVYRDGRNPTFWCSIGVLYYQINQYRDALDAYSRAIRLNPNISEVWYDLGTLYESSNNQTSDALDAYQRAAELDPDNDHIATRLHNLRNGQTSSHPNSNGHPAPQDVHPHAYQPAAVHAPPNPQWGPTAPAQQQQAQPPPLPQQPPPPPPFAPGREWNQRGGEVHPSHHQAPPAQPTNPYDVRDTPRSYQPPSHRQQSPRPPEHLRQDHHRGTPMRRPVSPSPRMRNAIIGPYGAPPGGPSGPPVGGPPQNQPLTRISNPNYGTPLPSAASHMPMPTQQGPLPPYGRPNSPPVEVKPIMENRPRSPRGFGPPPPHQQQHGPYPHHADPSGPSNIGSGAPAPMSALAAAEAAARERDERTPTSASSKRLREWDERDEGHNKKPANDENRARLEDPSLRRGPTPPRPSLDRRPTDRDREGSSRVHLGGPSSAAPSGPASPDHSRRLEEQRRATEAYKPSAAAHHPQPLNTVIHQERETQSTQLPPMNHTAPEQSADRVSPNNDAYQRNSAVDRYSTAPADRRDKDGDIRMRAEEPASRKIDVDEDYDDDSTEEAKHSVRGSNANSVTGGSGPGSLRASPSRSGPANASEQNHNGVANGQTAKIEA